MKKIAAVALALLFVLSLSACKVGGTDKQTTGSDGTYKVETGTKAPGTTATTPDTTTAPVGETTTTPVVTTAPEKETTAAPQPGTTAAPAITFTPIDKTVYVTLENVWVRSEPSTSGTGVATLHYGDSVRCVATSDSWFKIMYADKECYISASCVTFDNITTNDFEAVNDTIYVSVDVVSLRVGPSTDTEVKTYLTKGTSLTRIGKNTSWSKVSYSGGTYYIHNSCISTTPITTATTTKAP